MGALSNVNYVAVINLFDNTFTYFSVVRCTSTEICYFQIAPPLTASAGDKLQVQICNQANATPTSPTVPGDLIILGQFSQTPPSNGPQVRKAIPFTGSPKVQYYDQPNQDPVNGYYWLLTFANIRVQTSFEFAVVVMTANDAAVVEIDPSVIINPP